MTDAALEVRHVRLAEQATLRDTSLPDGGEGVFVAIDEPPPVRTVLAVVQGDSRRALQVVGVVEVPGSDDAQGRGFFGRWVEDEALDRAAEVGTEHLEDGTPQVQPVINDDSSGVSVSDTSMAMPAPVMMPVDDTGVIDVDEREDADGEDEATADEDTSEAESAEAEASGADEDSNDDNQSGGRRKRKKRGRRKR